MLKIYTYVLISLAIYYYAQVDDNHGNACTVQQNLVNSKLYNLKFHHNSNFGLILCPKEEKFI
jgi:hypothetical protein